MVKINSKSVSFRFKSNVMVAVTELVDYWGLSQTQVVERAILEARSRAVRNDEAFSQVVSEVTPQRLGDVGQENLCAHCGAIFYLPAGRNPSTLCPGCFRDGHRNDSNCFKCAERDHWKEKAAKDSAERSDVDYSAFQD